MPPISILVGTVQLFFRKMGHPRTLSHLFLSFQTNITIFATKNVYPVYSNPRPSENESPPITTRPNTYFIFDISWTSLNEMLFLLWSNFFSLIWMHLPWTDRKLASAREREREREQIRIIWTCSEFENHELRLKDEDQRTPNGRPRPDPIKIA